MTYSSGLFSSPEISLSQAQKAKYQRMSQSQTSKTVTKWSKSEPAGADSPSISPKTMMLRSPPRRSATAFNYAKALIRSRGLEHRINLLRQDYREVSGTFDRFVRSK